MHDLAQPQCEVGQDVHSRDDFEDGQFRHRGQGVRLIAVGNEVGPFGSGMEHLYRCLRRLALVSPIDPEKPEIESVNVGRDVVEHDYAILLTAAAPGSIPANVWRTSHVIYL